MTKEEKLTALKLAFPNPFPFFEYDGILFYGDFFEILKKYEKLKPSKPFRTWLIHNIKQIHVK